MATMELQCTPTASNARTDVFGPISTLIGTGPSTFKRISCGRDQVGELGLDGYSAQLPLRPH
jgi:hypothetical protein